MDVPVDFYSGVCEAAEVRTVEARGDGQIIVLDKTGRIVKYLDPSTTTIWVTARHEDGAEGR